MGLNPVPDELVTYDELAAIMRISRRSLERMKEDGMPHVSWGRRFVRFRVAEALAWAEQQDRVA